MKRLTAYDEQYLLELAHNTVKLRARLVPELSIYKLHAFMTTAARFRRNQAVRNAEQIVIRRAFTSGALSDSSQGNYSVRGALLEEVFLNPELEGKQMYFVLEKHAEEFAGRLCLDNPIISIDGAYVVPDNPSPHDWQVMRVKREFGGGNFSNQLCDKKILSAVRKGGFSVAHLLQNERDERRYLNLKYRPNDRVIEKQNLYFVQESFAQSFLENCLALKKEFDIRGTFEIIQHQK